MQDSILSIAGMLIIILVVYSLGAIAVLLSFYYNIFRFIIWGKSIWERLVSFFSLLVSLFSLAALILICFFGENLQNLPKHWIILLVFVLVFFIFSPVFIVFSKFCLRQDSLDRIYRN